MVSPRARLLVLGSFPGAASLKAGQYYAHPRNQFWAILSALWGLEGARSLQLRPPDERLAELLDRGLALWDVYDSCERQGSLDNSIRRARLNDLPGLCARLPSLQAIAHNGSTSARHAAVTRALGLPVHTLPSSSPAHASWSLARKVEAWRSVFEQAGLVP